MTSFSVSHIKFRFKVVDSLADTHSPRQPSWSRPPALHVCRAPRLNRTAVRRAHLLSSERRVAERVVLHLSVCVCVVVVT